MITRVVHFVVKQYEYLKLPSAKIPSIHYFNIVIISIKIVITVSYKHIMNMRRMYFLDVEY